MGGLVIDIFIMYSIKAVARAYSLISSERWERVKAKILDITLLDPDVGCTSVRVDYQLSLETSKLNGREEIPFVFRWSARDYMQLLSNRTMVKVRVNPQNPKETLFFESDQRL